MNMTMAKLIRVLLADDHAMMRDGLRALLSVNSDMEVVAEASTGNEAVRLATEFKPDVVVLDIAMPDLNGTEAARMICAKLPLTRIVMLSMHANSEHVHRALEAGASAYVLKESAAAEVITAIRTVVADGRYFSPTLMGVARDGLHRKAHVSPLDSLSARERQVLQLVAEGRSSAEIAELVHLSPKTVETYRSRLMAKLDCKSLAALIKFAVEHGITPPG